MATADNESVATSHTELASQKADVEEEEKAPQLLPPSTYQIRPSLSETFRASKVKDIIQNVLSDTLQGKTYDKTEAADLTKTIADQVNTLVRDLNMRRYKHVVQVTLGQQMGAGCRCIARCRWDAECDNHTSDVFTNASLFCICTVFGVYLY